MPDGRFRFEAFGTDLVHAARLDRLTWLDLVQATIELTVARVRLRRQDIRHLLHSREVLDASPALLDREQLELVDRVAFAIPRAARRVPFRSDCLIQALAARRWLHRRGIAARVTIGVKPHGTGRLDAHAWLEAGGRIVTGGDIADYSPFASAPLA